MALPKSRNQQFKDELEELKEEFETLKVLYDKYFIGIERIPPVDRHDRFEVRLRQLVASNIGNSALRFQIGSLRSAVTSLSAHWKRQLEKHMNGTSNRDRFRMKMKFGSETALEASKKERALERDKKAKLALNDDHDFSLKDDAPARPERPAADDSRDKDVFKQYVSARKTTGEGIGNLSYEKMQKVIEKQRAAIKEKYGAKDVDFKVVVEDGKTKLKAIPKK